MTESRTKSNLAWQSWVPWVLSAILFVTIACGAPNFRKNSSNRVDPYGGDFLQEYVGGQISVEHPAQLYDLEVSRRYQHDDSLEFAWTPDRYFPMVYPPFYYLAMSPLAKLSYPTAAHVWLFLMAAAFGASLLLLARANESGSWWPLGCCLCYPVMMSLSMGQKGTLLLLLWTATYLLLRRQRPFWAGAVFACVAFKPHLAIVFALAMLLKRQWSFLIGCATTLSVLLLGCTTLGLDVCGDYVNVCLGAADYVRSGGYHLDQGFSLWSAWQLALGSPPLAKAGAAICGLTVVLALLRCLSGRLEPTGDRFADQFSAITVTTVLISPHFYAYDLSILVLPAVLSFRGIASERHLPSVLVCCSLVVLLFATPWLIGLAASTSVHLGVALLVGLMILSGQTLSTGGSSSWSVCRQEATC